MADSMIERVARAICKSQTQSEAMWQAFLPEASAAIEAMREPTDAMVDDGYLWDVPTTIYRAMIDAALSEHQS